MKRIPFALLACLLLSTVAAGCATEQPFVWVSTLPSLEMKPDGVIRPRDSIVAVVRDHPDLSGEFVVRDDGGVLYPTIGDIHLGDLSTEAATAELRSRIS